MKKSILSALILGAIYALILSIIEILNFDYFLAEGLSLVLSLLIGTRIGFNIIEYIYPSPLRLTLGEKAKSFLQSKVFWLALLNFVAAALQGILDVELDLETQLEIVNLNWGNLFQALASVVIISLRKFDVLKMLL